MANAKTKLSFMPGDLQALVCNLSLSDCRPCLNLIVDDGPAIMDTFNSTTCPAGSCVKVSFAFFWPGLHFWIIMTVT